MKLGDANLQVNEKRLIHVSSFMYFAFVFSEYITFGSFEETLKMSEHYFFKEINEKKCYLQFTCSLSQLYSNGIWPSLDLSTAFVK